MCIPQFKFSKFSQSFCDGKRRSQKFHPTFKIGFTTWQGNKANELKFSQWRVEPTVSSLFQGLYKYFYSRLNIQHSWRGGLYDHLASLRIFTMIINKILIWAPNFMRKMTITRIWSCQSPCTSCMFHIQQEVGVLLKMPSQGTNKNLNSVITT